MSANVRCGGECGVGERREVEAVLRGLGMEEIVPGGVVVWCREGVACRG